MTRIEQAAHVYLDFDQDGGGWTVSEIMFDGDPCFGNDHPHIEFDGDETDEQAKFISDELYLRAELAPLPNARQLTEMLAEGLGLKLVRARDHCRNAVPCEACRAPMGVACYPGCPINEIQRKVDAQ